MREPVSGLLHVLGVLAGGVGLYFLVGQAQQHDSLLILAACLVYGLSQMGLFFSSSLYHLLDVAPHITRRLRILDHMMIFVFIAGSYTPICVVLLNSIWGWLFLALVWAITLSGIIMKIYWLDAPRWLYTCQYVLLGWISMLIIYPLYQVLSAAGLMWLVTGGLFYTVGAAVYVTKWPDPFPLKFGFHEIWHVFVLFGAAAHFWTIYRYVV